MPSYKIIYSKRVMEALVEHGVFPLKTMPNPYKPEFMCWIFQTTKEFQKIFEEVMRHGR